ncbi:MAG TPA: outer membrane lipoprotein chaperone LolA [Candidatus Accumulibacter phosphatis]|nr:MAG: Outer-membrane lipoprotein carrier protein precursor [Candidatus Accumulibacter sp. SK-11]HAY29816.1 outer membrane lipoprotein carrier protein LolA [Accumulibacter sp.]HCN68244.1 outer membrane lipoprotein carrier protein LolA [Accumulibacter sp.]HRL78302.1 outer membrane lipoprotein chaperone LolA [Candidatus Accumulibacter phosphatis]HRQ94218.1 outer membrane lipoprotein chaperone LolA [Candidatus Accumulibacter phosphatis]
MNWRQSVCVVFCLLSTVGTARAGAIDRLQHFLDTTRTLRADFAQTVVARNGRLPQKSSGVMMFSRPGKFRWQIDRPYSQLVVGDGEKISIHDPELRQVTVRKTGIALGGTPAALLAGDRTIDRDFSLREAGEQNGIEWLEATPKAADSGFDKVRIGFSGNELRAMELFDNLGQTTMLLFSRVEINPRLAPSLFRFTPPANTDVIGD